jgi:hypothetical protein
MKVQNRAQGSTTHDDDRAKVALELIPVVAVVDTENLILDAQQVLHARKNGDSRLLHYSGDIWSGLCDVGSDSLIRGSSEVALVCATPTEKH